MELNSWMDKFEDALQKLSSKLESSGQNVSNENERNISLNSTTNLDTNSQCFPSRTNVDDVDSDPLLDVKFGIFTINDEDSSSTLDLSDERRNDREEIRRKLAMDSDTEDYISEKLNQHRTSGSSFDHLKGSGSLQICFMNEAANDQEFFNHEDEKPAVEKSRPLKPAVKKPPLPPSLIAPLKCDKSVSLPLNNTPLSVTKRQRPKFFFNRPRSWHASKPEENESTEEDLLTRHIRLQTEAREALAQAKDMAKMQMELERQKKKKSPIADIVGLPFPDGKNLLTHHALISMNVAQLQVIVNDLHSQIETLNEDLVKFLLERDDLHMEQDSMLVDIEDLTRYLGLKGNSSTGSSGSQGSVNMAGTSNNKKFSEKESVKRSQSVHLKSKNLM